jgi:hypothetical protein
MKCGPIESPSCQSAPAKAHRGWAATVWRMERRSCLWPGDASGDDDQRVVGVGVIKSLFRVLAFLLLAAGFVGAIMDGARSLANATLDYAHVGSTALRLFGERFSLLQPAIERNIHPFLWDPVIITLLLLPTSAVLLVTGLMFYRLGRRSGAAIGYITRN